MNANVHKAMNTDHSPTLEAQVECEKPGMDDLKNIYIYLVIKGISTLQQTFVITFANLLHCTHLTIY